MLRRNSEIGGVLRDLRTEKRRRRLAAARAGVRDGVAMIGRATHAVGRGLVALVDEILLGAGLCLLGYGLSLTPWPSLAFIVPGAVLVWMTIPTRRSFVAPAATAPAGRSRPEERRAN